MSKPETEISPEDKKFLEDLRARLQVEPDINRESIDCIIAQGAEKPYGMRVNYAIGWLMAIKTLQDQDPSNAEVARMTSLLKRTLIDRLEIIATPEIDQRFLSATEHYGLTRLLSDQKAGIAWGLDSVLGALRGPSGFIRPSAAPTPKLQFQTSIAQLKDALIAELKTKGIVDDDLPPEGIPKPRAVRC